MLFRTAVGANYHSPAIINGRMIIRPYNTNTTINIIHCLKVIYCSEISKTVLSNGFPIFRLIPAFIR